MYSYKEIGKNVTIKKKYNIYKLGGQLLQVESHWWFLKHFLVADKV